MSLDFSERIALVMVANSGNNLAIAVAKLEERVADLEEGMTNFRDFTRTMRDFVSRSDERALHRAKQEAEEKEAEEQKDARRSRIHFWWLGLLSAVIITLLSYVLNWTHDFEKRHHVSESTTQTQPATHAKEE